jgi:hypothetical protein
MKTLLIAALTTLGLSFGAYAQKEKPAGKPAAKEETKKDDHADHDHAKKAGPTGGKLITAVEPHVEFFVNKDKKVEIRFVDDDNKVVAPGEQVISVTLGERSKPTRLTFTKDGDKLVSDKVIPAGNDYPTVVQIKTSAKAKAVNEKFNLNMTKCPKCPNPEYSCTCEHSEEEHDHKEGEKHDHEKETKKEK